MGAGADANGVDTTATVTTTHVEGVDVVVGTTPTPTATEGAATPPSATNDAEMRQLEEEADAETVALQAELAQSLMELTALQETQGSQLEELQGLRAKMSDELEALKEERWKVQNFQELEDLKQNLLATAGETDADADTAEESSTDAVPRAATASTAEGASSSTSYDPSSCEDAWGSEMDKLGRVSVREDTFALIHELDKEFEEVRAQLAKAMLQKDSLEDEKARLQKELNTFTSIVEDGSNAWKHGKENTS